MEFEDALLVDELRIMAGCFLQPYWIQNNRIKSLEIILDERSFMASFSDVEKIQSVKLKEAVKFSKARFIIKDIWPTEKWDDTGISEIQFFNNGKMIEISTGKYAEFLKITP